MLEPFFDYLILLTVNRPVYFVNIINLSQQQFLATNRICNKPAIEKLEESLWSPRCYIDEDGSKRENFSFQITPN